MSKNVPAEKKVFEKSLVKKNQMQIYLSGFILVMNIKKIVGSKK